MTAHNLADGSKPQLILGTGAWSRPGKAIARPQAERLLIDAQHLGISTIDTAASYGSGRAERLIGHLSSGSQFIQTKVGPPTYDWPARFQLIARAGQSIRQRVPRGEFPSPSQWAARLDRSIERLAGKTIQTFFLHSPPDDLDAARYEDAALQIVASKRAERIGMSPDSAILAEPPSWCAVLQISAILALEQQPLILKLIQAGTVIQLNRVRAATPLMGEGQRIASAVRHLAAEFPGCHIILSTTNPIHLADWVDEPGCRT